MISTAQLLKNYRWRQFLLKFGIRIFFVIFLPILLTLTLSFYYSTVSTSKTLAQKSIFSVEKEMETILSSFNLIHSSFSTDVDLRMYLLKSGDMRSEGDYVVKFGNDVRNFCLANSLIDSIYLYRLSDEYIIAAGNDSLSNNYVDNFSDGSFIKENLKELDYLNLRSTTINNKAQEFLTCSYPIYLNDFLLGFLFININTKNLEENILTPLPNSSRLCVFSRNKVLMCFPDDTVSNFNQENTDYNINLLTRTVSIGKFLRERNLTIILNYSLDRVAGDILFNFRFMIGLIIMILLLSLYITYLLTMHYYNTLVSFILKATNIFDIYEKNEVYSQDCKKIVKNISKNISKSSHLETELFEKMYISRNLQLQFLQSQISPHFLFNTLNIIPMLELKIYKNQSEISDTTRMISDVLRYSIAVDKYMIKFSSELDYSLKYLNIQKIRYSKKLDISYNIDESTYDVEILRFTLQPILENAIHYGIANDNYCTLNISAHTENETLIIDVANNGASLTKQELDDLNKKLKTGKLNPTHVSGLLNVNKRIILIYGEDYGCQILQENGTTHLIIKLPIK